MNIAQVNELIEKNFSNLKTVGKNIVRAEKQYSNKPIGIYYFDYSESFLKDGFDIKEYQDLLLSEDYYCNQGALQWNYYLYFVCDKERLKLLDKVLKEEIECNRIYSRKYVRTTEELDEELLNKTVESQKFTSKIQEDVSIKWIEKLRENDLDGIFVKKGKEKYYDYKEVFERFMDDKPIKEKINSEKKKAKPTDYPKLTEISNLKIEKFRKYPSQRDFSFSKANLIKGVNATGKTSLLEAIEKWICSRSNNRLFKVGIKFTDNNGYRYIHQNSNEGFRNCDLEWYNRHYKTGNLLDEGFRRFNFYDSDAAYKIVSAKSSIGLILSSLSNLMFGTEAIVIGKRSEVILKDFKSKKTSCAKEIKKLKSAIKEEKEALATLGFSPEDEQKRHNDFIEELKSLGWKGALPNNDDESLKCFSKEWGDVSLYLDECQSLDLCFLVSASNIDAEKKKLEDVIKKERELSNSINELTSLKNKSDEKIKKLSANLDNLREIKPYLQNRNISDLIGLDKKISEKKAEKNQYIEAKDIIKGIDLSDYLNIKEVFSSTEESLYLNLSSQQKEAQKQQNYINELESERGNFAKLIGEIKSIGQQIISSNPDVTSCPLCGADYKIGELVKKINAENEDIKESNVLNDLIEKHRQTQEEINKLNNKIEIFNKIQKAASWIIENFDPKNQRVNLVVTKLLILNDTINNSDKQITEFNNIKNQFISKGLSEEKYLELESWFKDTYNKNVTGDIVENLLLDNENEIQQIRHESSKDENKLSTLTSSRDDLLYGYFKSSIESIENVEAEFNERTSKINKAKDYFDKHIIPKLSLKTKDDISELSIRLRKMDAAYNRFNKFKNDMIKSSHINGKIQKMQEESSRLHDEKEKADAAAKVLNEIINSKNKYYKDFIDENQESIKNIFLNLHSPKEFIDIRFVVDESGSGFKDIILVRDSNEESKLTEISSGQRSAFALSIFLAMNFMLKDGAPPYIILDDPVAHIDDLNVLSFLDYLRDIVIEKNKQVFFATANQKIANLFSKKFEFFGDEFKSINLER
jgi:recombinational DNA repair ATPase RecF